MLFQQFQPLVKAYFHSHIDKREVVSSDITRIIFLYQQQLPRTTVKEDQIAIIGLVHLILRKYRFLKNDLKEIQQGLLVPKLVREIKNEEIFNIQDRRIVKKKQICRILLEAKNNVEDDFGKKFLGSQEQLSLGEVRKSQNDIFEENQLNLMEQLQNPYQMLSFGLEEEALNIQMSDVQLKLKERKLRFQIPTTNVNELVQNFNNLMGIELKQEEEPTRPNTKSHARRAASRAITVDKQTIWERIHPTFSPRNSIIHDISLSVTMGLYQMERFDAAQERDMLLEKLTYVRIFRDQIDTLLFDSLNMEQCIQSKLFEESDNKMQSYQSSYSTFQQFSEDFQLARDDQIDQYSQSDHFVSPIKTSGIRSQRHKSYIDQIGFKSSLQTIKETISKSFISKSNIGNVSVAFRDKKGSDKAIAFYELLLLVRQESIYTLQQVKPESYGDIICIRNDLNL